MMPHPPRRLIVNADDFGGSHSINQAVEQAHRNGVLTSASLMVNEAAFDEAVEVGRRNTGLGVGLHLTLVCGNATLPNSQIPGLANTEGRFSDDPVICGLRYFLRQNLRGQLKQEIAAQFQKFLSTKLPLDHVSGHLNMHMHPTVLDILAELASDFGIRAMRLTRDPFWLNARLADGRWVSRAGHAFIYAMLNRRSRPVLRRRGIRHTDRVFGLLQNGRMDVAFIEKLLPTLPPGDSELYSHPSLDEFGHELDALLSPSVRALIGREHIELIRYQDL